MVIGLLWKKNLCQQKQTFSDNALMDDIAKNIIIFKWDSSFVYYGYNVLNLDVVL